MALTSAGVQALAQKSIGETVANFTYVAVGSGNTAFNVAQTTLVAEYPTGGRKNCTPTRSGSVVTYNVTFGVDDADNGDWEEWGIFNASGTNSPTMLGRKAESLGSKPDGTQSWTFETTITYSAS